MPAPTLTSSKFGSYKSATAITPSDSTPARYSAIWVGGAGSVVLVDANGGAAVTLLAVPAGTLLPIATTLVKAASTATGLVGLR